MCLSSFQIALFSAIYILLLCCFCLTSTWAQFYQRRTEVSSDLSSSARPTLLLASHMHNFYQKGNITLNHLNRDFSFQKNLHKDYVDRRYPMCDEKLRKPLGFVRVLKIRQKARILFWLPGNNTTWKLRMNASSTQKWKSRYVKSTPAAIKYFSVFFAGSESTKLLSKLPSAIIISESNRR